MLQAAKQQHGRSAALEAAEQLAHFQALAHSLLHFWTTIDRVWSEAHQDAEPAHALAAQKPALELAVALTQTLTADTKGDIFYVVADVALRCASIAATYHCTLTRRWV